MFRRSLLLSVAATLVACADANTGPETSALAFTQSVASKQGNQSNANGAANGNGAQNGNANGAANGNSAKNGQANGATQGKGATKGNAFGSGAHGSGGTSSRTAALVQCQSHPTWVGSGTIGPSGGTLLVGSSRVIVPAGALDRNVFITATMPAGEYITIRFEFQPHGLVFKKPAGLILNASTCNIAEWQAPNIVYLGENGEILEYIESYYSNHWHTVAAPIWHFSGYAIAW